MNVPNSDIKILAIHKAELVTEKEKSFSPTMVRFTRRIEGNDHYQFMIESEELKKLTSVNKSEADTNATK